MKGERLSDELPRSPSSFAEIVAIVVVLVKAR